MKQVLGVQVRPTVVKEPVMNVPAIDMTDATTRAKRTSPPARKKNVKRSAPSRKQPTRAAQTKAQPKRTRDGSVGRETFERVEALVKQGKNIERGVPAGRGRHRQERWHGGGELLPGRSCHRRREAASA
jgi:hypothetical protein